MFADVQGRKGKHETHFEILMTHTHNKKKKKLHKLSGYDDRIKVWWITNTQSAGNRFSLGRCVLMKVYLISGSAMQGKSLV